MFWGLGMQFCFGLFVIRTQPGLIAFEWLGRQVQVLNVNVIRILNMQFCKIKYCFSPFIGSVDNKDNTEYYQHYPLPLSMCRDAYCQLHSLCTSYFTNSQLLLLPLEM